MTETAKHDDIEDVLSSIRRLVSDGSGSERPETEAAAERLVLTPALRVAEPENPYAHIMPNDPDADREDEAAVEDADFDAAMDDALEDELEMPASLSVLAEPEDAPSEMETGDVLVFRHSDSWARDAGDDDTATDQEAAEDEDWDSASLVEAALRGSDPEMLEDVAEDEDEVFLPEEAEFETPFEPEDGDTDWDDTESVQAALDIAAVRLARGEPLADPGEAEVMPVFARSRRRDEAPSPDLQDDMAAAEEVEAEIAGLAEVAEAELDAEAAELEGLALAAEEDAVLEAGEAADSADLEPGAEAEEPLDEDAIATLDEEALRELIAQAVREELQGALGQRITRNVRKMVRREIRLALAAEDFD